MEILLVPGFWLDASSWGPLLGALEAAGHRPRPLALPGTSRRAADRAGVTLADQVAATVRAIDGSDAEKIVLVGHSGGSHVVWGAADARPERVARIVLVDGFPVPDGTPVNPDLPVVDGEVPVPDWSFFDDGSLTDMTDEVRAEIERVAVPVPVGVAQQPLRLTDGRRLEIPVTVLASSVPSHVIHELIGSGAPFAAELAAATDLELVDLPTGHWPQYTRPDELARLVVAAIDR
ncbi:alpha/beta fold hydrolase [Georgenia sp. Z1344]|uniref:alpha/beta fold hydrolase n=1 Tax=Georgenia sp. Z1344 TaxID=3416706 RepID=UPI003CF954E1